MGIALFIIFQIKIEFSSKFEDSLDKQWATIFKLGREFYLDLEYDEEGNLITENMPKLDADWLNPNTRGRHILILPRPTSVPRGASFTDATQVPGGAPLRRAPLQKCNEKSNVEFEPSSFNTARIWGQPPAFIANLGHSVPSEHHGQMKVTKTSIVMQPILQDL